MAVLVTTKESIVSMRTGEITYPEGTAYDVDQFGHLAVFDNEEEQIGLHAAGEWTSARNVELVAGAISKDTIDATHVRISDNPQA